MNLNVYSSGVLIDPIPGGSNQDPIPGSSSEPIPGSSNSSEPNSSMANGLIAQALNSHRVAVFRGTDPLARQQTRGTSLPTAIWQWASSVRVHAVTRQILGSLRFAHGAYWLVPELAVDGSQAAAAKVLELKAPGAVRLKQQLDAVLDVADERPDRLAEILVQTSALWPFWTSITHVVPGQAPRTAELMAVVQAVGSHLGQQFKHHLAVPRPTDLSASVQPCITTPGHGAMPSGHAIAAFAALRLLKHLLSNSVTGGTDTVGIALDRTARRIAANRVVAGLHFPLDNSAGWCVAETTFEVVSMMAGRSTLAPSSRVFDADATLVTALPNDDLALNDGSVGSVAQPSQAAVLSSPLLTLLWGAAEEELARLQLN